MPPPVVQKPSLTNVGSSVVVSGVLHECESCNWADHVDGYQILSSDSNVRVTGSGNAAVILPSIDLIRGQTIRVSHYLTKKKSVTVTAPSGVTIGNSTNDTSEVLDTYGEVVTFRWNGSQWWVLSR